MKLEALTRGLEYTLLQGTMDKDVKALIYFSEKTVPGSMFFAVPGTEKNGLDYAAEAVRRGAETVVVQDAWYPPQNPRTAGFGPSEVTVLLVQDVRRTMAQVSCRFYGYPCRQLLTVGVTGTKGKTSTAFMIREMLECAGIPTGLIGTVKYGWDGHFQEADRTTPQPVEIQKWCRAMADHGCRAVVMEVSSQGMKQCRVEGIDFTVGVFTNLNADHIGPGEHDSFEEYAACKARLLQQCSIAVINEDEEKWKDWLHPEAEQKVITFGKSDCAAYRCTDIRPVYVDYKPAASFQLQGRQLYLPVPGEFNVLNAAGAAAAALELGADWESVAKTLKRIKIPGRLEPADTGGKTNVLVDYAHTGPALRQVLSGLRPYTKKRLIVVFGCGGSRDRNRRREMGWAAAELADLVIVTSDNPRNENPEQIIKDITDAMDEAIGQGAAGRYQIEPDRRKAILKAVTEGGKHDMILIAGKGHETSQLVNGEKIYFDDRQAVLDAVKLTGNQGSNKKLGEEQI